jgi:hypothetical protein
VPNNSVPEIFSMSFSIKGPKPGIFSTKVVSVGVTRLELSTDL